MDELYDAEVRLYSPLAWPLEGREALKAYVDEFHRAYGPVRIALHDEFYSADGTRGCFRFTFHYSNDGEFYGHPPTHERGIMVETHTVKIAQDKIIEQWVGDNSFQMPYMDLVVWKM